MPEQNKVTNKKLLLLLLAIIGVSVFLYFTFFNEKTEEEELSFDCFETKTRTISGNSMFPLINDGEVVTTYENYYNCNEIQRGDIVIFNFKTRDEDYIKKILGMPDDLLEIEQGFLKINGEYLLNSEGRQYKVDSIKEKILTIPLVNQQIPRNGYLVLGDNVDVSVFDSRQYGFINKSQIIGKIKK
ncbi:MAG: signal peptidase I [Candidatus Paceibacterota bacterium]